MSQNENIDQVFRTASDKYAPHASPAVWEKLEASLAARRRRKLIWWWITPAVLLGLTFFTLTVFNPKLNPENKRISTEKQPVIENANRIKPISDSENNTVEHQKTQLNQNLHLPKSIKNDKMEVGSKSSFKSQNEKFLKQNNLTKTISVAKPKNNKNQGAIIPNILQNTIVTAYQQTRITTTNLASQGNPNPTTNDNMNPSEIGTEINKQKTENLAQTEKPVHIEKPQQEEKPKDDSTTVEEYSSQKVPAKPEQPANPKSRIAPSFFVAYQLGFGATGGFYRQPNPLSETVSTTSKLSPEFELSSEISTGIYLKKWMLKFGFRLLDLRTQGDFLMPNYQIKYVKMDCFGVSPMGYYSVENIEHLLESKNFSNVDYLRNITKTKFLVSMTVLNFEAGRLFDLGRFRLISRSGFNIASLQKSIIEAGDANGYIDFGQIHDLKAKIFGISMGADIIYQSKSSFYVGLKSDFTLYLTSINTSKEFGFYPFSILIGPQMGFKF